MERNGSMYVVGGRMRITVIWIQYAASSTRRRRTDKDTCRLSHAVFEEFLLHTAHCSTRTTQIITGTTLGETSSVGGRRTSRRLFVPHVARRVVLGDPAKVPRRRAALIQ